MIGRRVVPALASVAIAIGGLTACGSDSSPSPDGGGGGGGDTTASSPAVAWMDKICGATAESGKTLSNLPSFDGNDPAKTKEALVNFMQQLSQQFDAQTAAIDAAGVPPVTDGQTAVDQAKATVDGAKTALDSSLPKLQAAPTDNPAVFTASLAEIAPLLAPLDNTQGVYKDLLANPELRQAFIDSPGCKQVDQGVLVPSTDSASAPPTS
ncbi:hypothetical protein [Actinokineospora pegani]|uniref:hypothetical protein n=1 Tax=Actinokineospora pegani TaxID=2654637 RepID=UPI0012EA5586|nr:hypothetical protein [Actinokineospora pegani]